MSRPEARSWALRWEDAARQTLRTNLSMPLRTMRQVFPWSALEGIDPVPEMGRMLQEVDRVRTVDPAM